MPRTEFNFRCGGAAGDGIASMGEILTKICSRNGLQVYSYNSYQSVIRGGHVWFSIRASTSKVLSPGDRIDILIAIDTQSIDVHKVLMNEGGIIIFDDQKSKAENIPSGVTAISVPFAEIAKSLKVPQVQNTVAIGAALYFYDIPLKSLLDVLDDQFGSKSEEIRLVNHKAPQAGYDYVKTKNCAKVHHELKLDPSKRHLVMTGSQATGVACIAGGLKFYAAYPMTPASPILHFLAAHAEEYGVLVKQMEDELSVINIAIGASSVGVRSACGTSGGGFALMTEAVGMAGILETPLVVFLAMRGGPSTGLPTKTEQGDLNQLLGASQGDFPRIIIAYSDVEDCYYATLEALNLADKYQLPVLLASDLGLAEHSESVSEFDFSKIIIDRHESFIREWNNNGSYKRYKVTDSGVSPRVIPGTPNVCYDNGSDEHDEEGKLISDVRAGLPESIEIRKKMMHKRMSKVEFALKDLPPPVLVGPKDAQVTLVSWGSTKGTVAEAIQKLAKERITANHLHIKYVHPFHGYEVKKILEKSKLPIMIECNYSGQMAHHIRAETGFNIEHKYLKFDGEPLYAQEVVDAVKEVVMKK